MEPLRRMAGAQHFLAAASTVELAQVVLVLPFPWTQAVTPRGVHCRMGSPASAYLPAQALAQTGEGTPAVSQDSGTRHDKAVCQF